MKGVLCDMVEIYEPNGIDWMGFHESRKNPYTFHHIQEKKNKGDVSIKNGAILTKYAHQLLNILENVCPKAYDDYQNLFRYINNTHAPLTDDILEDIYGMMLDTFYYQDYGDLSSIKIDKGGLQKVKTLNKKQKYINKR